MSFIRLKKNEDRRLRAGHLWIYSNEIDTKITPLKNFTPGQEVIIEAHDKSLLGTAYFNPHSLITARLFSRNSKDHLDMTFFSKKIAEALQSRQQFFKKPFYRLVYGESDGLPGLVIDRFNDTCVIQTNTTGMDIRKSQIIEALLHVLPEIKAILFRNDSSARKFEHLPEEVIAGFGTPAQEILLEENNVSFYAPLWEGQKTGWFYDHRMNRARLKDYVTNRSVLDVFSYLGGWGIQAAVFGASSVTCIDSSERATAFIQKNAELNQVNDKINIIHQDAFIALKNLIGQQFDVIILDPPAFVKKQKDLKEGLLAYQRLNEAALKLLSPGGILISCSCSMHVSYDELLNTLRRAALRNKNSLQIIERGHQGLDHPIHLAIPETDYLKMIVAKDCGSNESGKN